MLTTSIKAQHVIRLQSTSTGEVDVTGQKHNDYFQDEPKGIVRIAETDKGYTVTILAKNVIVLQPVSADTASQSV